MDLSAGLLGGIKGAGTAVGDIAEDKRKALAERLKAEAMETLRYGHDMSLAEKGIAAEKELSGQRIAAEKEMTGQKISSEEKIASERNKNMKEIATMEAGLKRELAGVEKNSAKAQEMRAKVAAFAEARKVIENGGSTEEANAVLDAVGLPLLEEYVIEEGSKGFLGFGDKPEVIGRRPVGSKSGMSTGGGIKGELDALLSEGMSMGQPQASTTQGGGLLSSHFSKEKVNPELPEDPSQWNVQDTDGKFIANVNGKQIELTNEEYVYWLTNKDKAMPAY